MQIRVWTFTLSSHQRFSTGFGVCTVMCALGHYLDWQNVNIIFLRYLSSVLQPNSIMLPPHLTVGTVFSLFFCQTKAVSIYPCAQTATFKIHPHFNWSWANFSLALMYLCVSKRVFPGYWPRSFPQRRALTTVFFFFRPHPLLSVFMLQWYNVRLLWIQWNAWNPHPHKSRL